MTDFKPMLAGAAPPLTELRYPVLTSPKLDGVRAVIRGGQVLSRSLLPIPCPTVQELFGDPRFNGLDGELIFGEPTAPDVFRVTSSFVMSHAHVAPHLVSLLRFFVFDDFSAEGGFGQRLLTAAKRVGRASKIFVPVTHQLAVVPQAVEVYEEQALEAGYEGLMIRDRDGRYKHGRSTTREGLLLKLKRFEDAEAVVLAATELKRNSNEERTGGLVNRRSSRQAGLVGGEVLGSLTVRVLNGPFAGVEVDVGTGFSAEERERLWQTQNGLVGQTIRLKYFAGGAKDKPRFPTFQGFRHAADL